MVKLRLVLAGPSTAPIQGRLSDVFLHFSDRSAVRARRAVCKVIERGISRAKHAQQLVAVPVFTGSCPNLDSAASLVAIALLYGYRPVVLRWKPRVLPPLRLCHYIIWFAPVRFSGASVRASYILRQALLIAGYLATSFAPAGRRAH